MNYRKISFPNVKKYSGSHLSLPSKNSNGLFKTLFNGYSKHTPIQISPDDVLNCVSCLWSKYVNLNSEKFREYFVDHQDKKALIYKTGGNWGKNRLPEFIDGLTEIIKEEQNNSKNLLWLDKSFTTTSNLDLLIRNAALLASQKEYYEYHGCLLCGFPEINLLGTKEDWTQLLESIKQMPTFDDIDFSNWKQQLIEILPEFIKAEPNENFWQKAITDFNYGSGPSLCNGWAKVFNPFKENGEWLHNSELDYKHHILDLIIDFEININDNGNKFIINVNAGIDGCDYKNETITPNKRLEINEI